MLHLQRGREVRLAAGLVAALMCVLMGCTPGELTSSPPQSGQSARASTPVSATPTATWNVQCTAQGLPQGWTWYRDARFPFRVAAPPTWRMGAFEYVPDGSGLGAASPSYVHVVDFFGPGSLGQARSSGKMRSDGSPPLITIEVGPGEQAIADGYASGRFPASHAQPTPVCIGSIPVTVYLFTNSEGGNVVQVAVLPAGPQGSSYVFTVASNAETAARDGQLFLTMLGTFGSPTSAQWH
ncbi:MAG TPA: hypothetical protein VF510_24655 [Ktedonobacterales bacterium]